MLVLANQSIAGLQGISTAEVVIATISVPGNPGRVRVRGQVPLVGGSGGASTIQLRIRQGSLTGNQIFTTGLLTIAVASGGLEVPFEIEDDSSFTLNAIPPGIAVWVLTAISSIAGGATGSSGNICVESLP